MRYDEDERKLNELDQLFQTSQITAKQMEQCIEELDEMYKRTEDILALILKYAFQTIITRHVNDLSGLLHSATFLLQYANERNYSYYVARAYLSLGIYYNFLQNSLTSFDYYWNAFQTVEGCKEQFSAESYEIVSRMIQNNIGACLSDNDVYDEALKYFTALSINYSQNKENEKDQFPYLIIELNRIRCYYYMNDYEYALHLIESLAAYQKSIPALNKFSHSIIVWEYMISFSVGNTEHADEMFTLLYDEEGFNTYNIVTIPDLLKLWIQTEQYDKMPPYIELFLKQAESDDNKAWRLDGYKFKMKYCYHMKAWEEYNNACIEVARLTTQKDEETARTRKESLCTYIQVAQKAKEQEQLKKSHELLKHKSEIDELTNLPNRYRLTEFSMSAFASACREQKKLCVEIVDVDFFKQVNDNYGHHQGDICLTRMAKELNQTILDPEKEICCRYGGDEFVIVRIDKTDQEILDSMYLLKQAVMNLGIPNKYSKAANVVTISQGAVNRIPSGDDTLSGFLKQADECLYEAKRISKNTVVLYE